MDIFFSSFHSLVQVQNMLNIAFYATPVTVCSSPQIVQSNKKSRGVGYALFLPLLNISILIIIQNIGSATYCPYIHLLGVFSLSTYRLIQIYLLYTNVDKINVFQSFFQYMYLSSCIQSIKCL